MTTPEKYLRATASAASDEQHVMTENPCDHDFTGWREFQDGGGEQVCSKCGMGAMAYTLRTGF